jgi:hypothetical protein
MSVPDAGRLYYDLGRNASYEAARRGDIPTIRIGRLLRVPVVAMERRLALAGTELDGSIGASFDGKATKVLRAAHTERRGAANRVSGSRRDFG